MHKVNITLESDHAHPPTLEEALELMGALLAEYVQSAESMWKYATPAEANVQWSPEAWVDPTATAESGGRESTARLIALGMCTWLGNVVGCVATLDDAIQRNPLTNVAELHEDTLPSLISREAFLLGAFGIIEQRYLAGYVKVVRDPRWSLEKVRELWKQYIEEAEHLDGTDCWGSKPYPSPTAVAEDFEAYLEVLYE